ncbi:CopD family protein [Kiloniella laminariae]|uniref:CopD family protein n=1 Tax=Kiloniella laminariae TaxID=454162 RepID=A0ABT4LK17_9PROT|nr:CopD family protein [Kiloniella laminariae]MCZ4281453.1 CopD family protein [Kiloniella laminariae]
MFSDTLIELLLLGEKAVLYGLSLFACGSTIFSLIFSADIILIKNQIFRLIRRLSLCGILFVALSLATNTIWLGGGEITALADLQLVQLVLFSDAGKLSMLLALGFLLFTLSGTTTAISSLSIIGLLLILTSYVLTGHTSLYSPEILLKTLILFHLVVASFWAGSFAPLLMLLKKAPASAAPTLEHFGRVASWLIPLLLISGAVMAWFIAGGFQGLFNTAYGWVLLGKIGIVGLLLGVAGLNKLYLVPSISRGSPLAIQHLQRSIWCEILLVVVILLATASITTLVPPENLGHRM